MLIEKKSQQGRFSVKYPSNKIKPRERAGRGSWCLFTYDLVIASEAYAICLQQPNFWHACQGADCKKVGIFMVRGSEQNS